MADGTQVYNLPPQVAPAVNAMMQSPPQGVAPQVAPGPRTTYNLPTAPDPYQPMGAGMPATQQVAPWHPDLSQLNAPPPAAPMGGPGGVQPPQQPQDNTPKLEDAWAGYAAGIKDHKPTRADFDKFAQQYQTRYVDPFLTSYKGAKNPEIKAHQGEFQLRASQLGDTLFPDNPDNDHWYSGFGSAFGKAAKGEAQKLGGGALAAIGALANRVVGGDFGDSLMRQANSNVVHGQNLSGETRDQVIQRFMGAGYNDPAHAGLRAKLEQQFDQRYGGSTSMASEGNQDLDAAYKLNRGGALAGQVATGAAPIIGATVATGGADIPVLAAGGLTSLAGTTANASDQLNQGQDSNAVRNQATFDAGVGTLLNALPVHTPGANVLKRMLQAGGVNAATSAGQQVADQAINPNNHFDWGNVGVQGLTGVILGMFGGNKGPVNSKNPLKFRTRTGPAPDAAAAPAPDTTGAPGAPPAPAGSPAAAHTEAAPAPGAASSPADQFNAAINTNADPNGVSAQSHASDMGSFNKELNAQGKSKGMQAAIKGSKDATSLVENAVGLARTYIPEDTWNTFSADQRQFAIEEAATFLAKKSGVDAGEVANTIQQFTNPQPATPAAAPAAAPAPEAQPAAVKETPLPADVSGQQVPGTQPQANPTMEQLQTMSGGAISGQHPEVEAQMLWNVANGTLKDDALAGSPLGQSIARLAQQGVIKSPADVQTVLEKLSGKQPAEASATAPVSAPAKPANPLKPKTNAEQAQQHDNVASTVTEALATPSTPEAAKNKLKGRVRQNAEQKANEQFLEAVKNTGVSSGAAEDAIRTDPHFMAVRQAVQEGRVTSPEQLGAFLKNERDLAEAANQQVATPVTKPKGIKKQATPPPESASGKPLKKEATPSPKSEAPVANTGAAATELEQQLRNRFNDTLPQHAIDQMHDAVANARMGDARDLGDLLQGWKDSGDISKEDAQWLRQQAKLETTTPKAAKPRLARSLKREVEEANANESEPNDDYLNDEYHQNNASGESSASLEAQNRLRDEKAAGQTRAIIRRDGSTEPLTGVDAVDRVAKAGEVIVQRGVGKDDWTVLSHGDDLTRDTASGKLNRVRDELNGVHEGTTHAGNDDDFGPHGEYNLHIDDLEALADERNKSYIGTEKELDRIAPLQVKRRVNKILDGVRKGADIHETGEELQRLSNEIEQQKMQKLFKDRPVRRGTEYVRQRLQEMIASSNPGDDHYEAGKFAQWLLDKNPNLGNYLAVRIHDLGVQRGKEYIPGPAGRFSPSARMFHINSDSTNPGTAVHEIMHSAEQLMPPELQNKIRGEYIGRLQNKIKQVEKTGNTMAQRYLELAAESYVNPSAEAQKEMSMLMRTQRKDIPYDEYYKYSNPSEYWAVESTDMLNNRYMNNGFAAKIKDWLGGFFQHVKSLLGLDSNHQVSKALDAIMQLPGADYNDRMLASDRTGRGATDELHDEQDQARDEEAETLTSTPTNRPTKRQQREKDLADSAQTRGVFGKVDTGIEQLANARIGVERAMQGLRRSGIEITPENNVEDATYLAQGKLSSNNNLDSFDTIQPVKQWVDKNYQRFAGNKKEFLDNTNKFFQNTHWLERLRTSWLMEAPMKSAVGEVQRGKLLDDVESGKLDPVDANKKLEAMQGQMKYDAAQWGRNHDVPVETIQNGLNELKTKYGMDQNSMTELNGLMDGARDRQTQRLIASGDVAKDDPWTKFYNWKWYVPLKGKSLDTPDTQGVFDSIQRGNVNLAQLNQTIKAMEGRSSFAEKPFMRLFVDTMRAGQYHANADIKNALYNLAADPKSRRALGATIATYDGIPHDGFTNTETGEKVSELPKGINQITVHDGRTHYVITLPKDSQLLRGLVQMSNIERPNMIERKVSKVTNTIARLDTTVSPVWQTLTAFVRDLTYVPMTIAPGRFDNPLSAVPFFTKYTGNALKSIGALRYLVPYMKNDLTALDGLAKQNPGSLADWMHRYYQQGGSNEFVNGFDLSGMERIFGEGIDSLPRSADGVMDATKLGWNNVLKYTGRYADFLTQLPRIAAFRTLVEQGVPEAEAAAEARKVLDYSNSGVKGRRINSWLAFFRVAATGVDAMRRAFTKPTGEFDFVKLAKYQAFYSALGAMGYMASSMMLGKDEDGKDVMGKMLPETIATRVLFPLGGNNVGGWQIGLGLPQVMMAPGALMAAVSSGNMSMEDAGKAYYKVLMRNSAFEPGGVKGNTPADFAASIIKGFTPTVARPLLDIADNTNDFGYGIHKDARPNQYHSDAGKPNTPDVFKDSAQFINKLTNGAIDFYPEDLQYLTKNYGGQWASTLISHFNSTDQLDVHGASVPGLVHDQDFYQQRQLYSTLDELNDANRRYNAVLQHAKEGGATDQQAQAQAEQMLMANPDLRAQRQLYAQLASAAGARAQAMKQLRDNRIMSQQGKELQMKQLDSRLRQTLDTVQSKMQ